MDAEDRLRAGDIDGALQSLQDGVRKDPADPALRVFLFQLLSVQGNWQRAATQLKVATEMDAAALPMKHTYGDALLCEALRSDVFAGERSPLIFGEPEPWIAQSLNALELFAKGNIDAFTTLHEASLEAAPATSGTLNGEAFEWIADADSRIGPLLEAIVNGRYYWIPFHRIHRIVIEDPTDLRDAIWTPAYFTWANGGETVGLIPTRYEGSHTQDAPLALSRATHWNEPAEGIFQGFGQRTLATSENDYALMDCREIVLDTLEEG